MDAASVTPAPTHPVEIVTGVHGTFVAPCDDLITSQIKTFGAHARNELAFLRSIVRPGDILVDIGAHIGTFAVPLAQSVGDEGAVLAIEGSPFAYALLCTNIQVNGLGERVQTRHALLGRVGEFTDRETFAPGNTGSTRFARKASGRRAFLSPLDVIAEAGFSDASVIKMDVEGMEGVLLDELRPLLRRTMPALYFEVSPALRAHGTGPEAIGASLRDLGYRLYGNVGPRNSATDSFRMVEFDGLRDEKKLFDCLAIRDGCDRAAMLMSAEG